jgi:hypothetical protein
MLHFIIGTPSRFTEWCTGVAASLAHRAIGTCDVIHADTLDEVARGSIEHSSARMVVCSTSPGGRLRAAITQSKHKFVLCITEPRQALADFVIRGAVSLPTALRHVASSCGAISDAIAIPSALPLTAEHHGRRPLETAIVISRHLGIELSDADLKEIADEHAKTALINQYVDAEAWWHCIRDDEREAVQGTLAPYLDGPIGESPSIRWQPELFSSANRPHAPLRGPIDMTGLARPLVQGPNIRIAHGKWSVALSLKFSAEASEHEFLVEIFGCEPPQHHLIHPSPHGTFEGTTEIMIPEEVDTPLNICLSSLRAAFDGTVTFVGAQLTRSASEGGGSDAAAIKLADDERS